MSERRKSYRERYFENYEAVKVPAGNRKGWRTEYRYVGHWAEWDGERPIGQIKAFFAIVELAGIAVYAAAILSRTPVTVSKVANGFGGLSLVPWILELSGVVRFIAAGEYVKEMDRDEIDRSIRSGSAMRILLAALSMAAGLIDVFVHKKAAAGDALVVLAVAVSIGATWLVRHVYAKLTVTSYGNQNGAPGRRI